MKTRNTLIWFLLVSMFLQVAKAQTTEEKADALFGKFAYAKAIPLYEEMVANQVNMLHAYQRLAESYLLIRDFEKSLPYFEKFIESPQADPDNYFKYAMALKSVGQEEASLYWLKRYKKTNKNDKLLSRFLEDGNLASVVFNSRERYEVFPVNFNSEFNDFSALTFDGKTYFSSSRPTDNKSKDLYEWDNQPWLDIYYINDYKQSFSGRMSVATIDPIEGDINSEYHESSPAFSTDYKNDTVVYFTRNNFFDNNLEFHVEKSKQDRLIEKTNNLKIYRADRVNGKWEVTKNLDINADHYSTGHPSVNPNRTKLYFASDRPGGYGGTDIYYCDIHPRGGLGSPVNAGPVVNTAGDEMFPFVNNEGKLFFTSDGHVGFGQLDIFTTITDQNNEIVEVINLGNPINSPKDDFAFFANEEGTEGFISSNRIGGRGGDDIYRFDFTPSLYLDGYVFDAVNDRPLDSVTVQLMVDGGKTFVREVLTDENGYYRVFVNRNTNYTLSLTRKTHPNKQVDLNTFNIRRKQRKISQDIWMEPVMDVKILAGLNKIYFDFDKSFIRPDAARELDKVVKLMLDTYPYMVIRLEAHTDPVGSHEYNDVLSQARAKSTYDYLISQGVPVERILSYKGFGKRQPVNDCKTLWDCPPKKLELNRRTEFPIISILNPESKKTAYSFEADK